MKTAMARRAGQDERGGINQRQLHAGAQFLHRDEMDRLAPEQGRQRAADLARGDEVAIKLVEIGRSDPERLGKICAVAHFFPQERPTTSLTGERSSRFSINCNAGSSCSPEWRKSASSSVKRITCALVRRMPPVIRVLATRLAGGGGPCGLLRRPGTMSALATRVSGWMRSMASRRNASERVGASSSPARCSPRSPGALVCEDGHTKEITRRGLEIGGGDAHDFLDRRDAGDDAVPAVLPQRDHPFLQRLGAQGLARFALRNHILQRGRDHADLEERGTALVAGVAGIPRSLSPA